MSDSELRAAANADPDAVPFDFDWSSAELRDFAPKTAISLRVDQDVYAYFKSTGRGFQTRMNAVLRAFVNHQSKTR
jgi:uncharacterized protein (DUF4415 family)